MKRIGKTIRKVKIHIKQEVKFWLYRISDGIKEIINFSIKYDGEIIPKTTKKTKEFMDCYGSFL